MFSISTWHYDNVISTSSKTNLDVNLLFVEMSDGEIVQWEPVEPATVAWF